MTDGDKSDPLALERHAGTRILTVRQFLTLQRSQPKARRDIRRAGWAGAPLYPSPSLPC